VRIFHHSSLPALFAGLFDDAALFPPENAPMQQAVTAHSEHARSWYGDLLGAFVCPVSRLPELDSAAQHARFSDVHLALTVADGAAGLTGVRHATNEYGWLRVSNIEFATTAADLADAVAAAHTAAERGARVFVEIPTAQISPDVAATLAAAGLGLKIRTGGTTADAFPSSAELARALNAASSSGVRFKCTAGLHNAIRHADCETGFAHHGFLNVLLAVHAAGTTPEQVEATLDCTGAAALAERLPALSRDDVAAIRQQFRSIGTCSVREPLADLIALDLVVAP
jgi:hypothetical protein